MSGGPADGIVDAGAVPGGVGLTGGIPHDFIGENDLAVLHGGAFPVARAEVEAHAAAFEMPSETVLRLAGRRGVLVRDGLDFERRFIDLRHAGMIEGSFAVRSIDICKRRRDLIRSRDNDPASPGDPQQTLHEAFRMTRVRSGLGGIGAAVYHGPDRYDLTGRRRNGQFQRRRTTRRPDRRTKETVFQHGRAESGFETREKKSVFFVTIRRFVVCHDALLR